MTGFAQYSVQPDGEGTWAVVRRIVQSGSNRVVATYSRQIIAHDVAKLLDGYAPYEDEE